ncbi:hypothetical protein DTO013E5_9529 [Penicillium roqueforti]|nr:uncharacterized protein LCP9604111_8608 [Penicillium roqueforti]KAF9240754.1 hypothetical protein LCP9604111_8608 [Penicillium roqueforti]KAI1831979.1 hypothetical protein CBS147337_7051 [Penicillium roqueforti]KAI2673260.1 hypothetical protein CBS147355_7559 [Penicillium roqueforti]KAI2677356.1 hypothetical protein LCP963914a_8014 [Penicillium roqueforti]KAI2694789.1 hypothetical protein CBS147332_9553 [Penicillium roqueforti]
MEPLPSWPQSKRGGPRWHWWHRVCMECDDFINDPCDDPCSHWYPESQRLTIGGEWLRCCQIGYEEALDVLYGTNNFVMDNAMDTPFLISRILAPRCASFMTSMEISFAVNICKAGPDEDDWMRTYAAFFGLFEQSFRGVHRLRLQLKMPPSEIGEIFFDDERLRTFLKPFDRLSKGREWTRLQLCVPDYYFQRIKQIKPGQDRWELTDTMWGDQSLYPVCLAFGL